MLQDVRLVEIELFSYCNRTCSFCPNHFVDRISENKILPEILFKKIIQELVSYNYSSYISLSRYCEPLAFREILDNRIEYIRRYLPEVKIVANTNGDYDYEGVDIDELTVMDYDFKLDKEELGPIIRKSKPFNVRNMRLGKINYRGGALEIRKKYTRTFPCYEPVHFIGIDYNGSVMPCCNLRSDVSLHENYILGNVENSTLLEIYNKQESVIFRDKVGDLDFPEVCIRCSKTSARYTSEKPNIMNLPS